MNTIKNDLTVEEMQCMMTDMVAQAEELTNEVMKTTKNISKMNNRLDNCNTNEEREALRREFIEECEHLSIVSAKQMLLTELYWNAKGKKL